MAYLPIDIFQQIIDKSAPADIVLETENMIAFRDINPRAKVHILVVPKVKIISALEVTRDDLSLYGELFHVAKQVAEMEGLTGYKLHMNVGEDGGQIVPHLHLHLLSPDFKAEGL